MRLKAQCSDLEQLQPMQNQNAMLDACEIGDVAVLQQLFKTVGIRRGDNEYEPFFGEPVSATGPPPTCTMITAAVAHKQPAIVAYLLSIYRNVHLDRDSVLNAVLASPDRPTLEILHSHDSAIVNYVFNETGTTLLMEACRSSDSFLPLCLLRLGADPSECDHTGAGPLLYAVQHFQPLEVIVLLIEYGAIINDSVLHIAIRRKSLDCLKFLLDRARLENPKQLLKEADDTDDKMIIALIWNRASSGKKSPLKRRKDKTVGRFVFEERGEATKWWQIGR